MRAAASVGFCAVAAALLSAAAQAAPAPARFSVTVTGLLRTHWSQELSYAADECEFTSRTSGHKVVSFRSRRPGVIRARKNGFRLVLTSVAGDIAGNTGSGSSVSEQCGSSTQTDGAPLTGGFRQARLEVSHTEGTIRLRGLRPEVSDSTPWAPLVFGSAKPPLEQALGRFDPRKLANPRVKKIVVLGRYGDVVRLAGDAIGVLGLEVSWRVTLKRLRT